MASSSSVGGGGGVSAGPDLAPSIFQRDETQFRGCSAHLPRDANKIESSKVAVAVVGEGFACQLCNKCVSAARRASGVF